MVVGGPDQPGDILRDGEELAERWGKDILGRGHDKFKDPEEHSCKEHSQTTNGRGWKQRQGTSVAAARGQDGEDVGCESMPGDWVGRNYSRPRTTFMLHETSNGSHGRCVRRGGKRSM